MFIGSGKYPEGEFEEGTESREGLNWKREQLSVVCGGNGNCLTRKTW